MFNYPTLAEAYKVAALDATNKLRTVRRMRADERESPEAVESATS